MTLALKEEEEKEKKRREEEKKKKQEQSKEELHHKTEAKKESFVSEQMKGMPFGEARPITEVGFTKVHIKGTLASEKYEPTVKETLAVKLIEEEKRKELEKEKEKLVNEVKKSEEVIRKEEEALRKIKEERRVAEEKIKEKEEMRKEKEEIEKRKEKIRKEKEQIKNLLEEARKKGMYEPIQDLARELLLRELRRGNPPKMALQNVIAILKRLDLIKTKKEKKTLFKFLKSLLNL